MVELLAEQQPSLPEAWLDVDQAAAYLACSPKRIYDLVSQRRLRRAREGRRLLFQREWLDAVVEVDGGDNDTPGGLESRATRQYPGPAI